MAVLVPVVPQLGLVQQKENTTPTSKGGEQVVRARLAFKRLGSRCMKAVPARPRGQAEQVLRPTPSWRPPRPKRINSAAAHTLPMPAASVAIKIAINVIAISAYQYCPGHFLSNICTPPANSLTTPGQPFGKPLAKRELRHLF